MIETVKTLSERGLSYSQIGAVLGISRSAVAGMLFRLRNPERAREYARAWHKANYVPRAHPRQKLSMDDARRIRASLAAGARSRVLAAAFGVSEGTISHIKAGRIHREPAV